MSNYLEKLFLLLILLFACFLYLYKLDTIPSSVYVDEAVVGYNAYSILETGKDEYGKSLPIAFRFFGSYTPPLFVYFSIPFVKLFGLNIFSIRLVSLISGLLNIIIIYFFVKNISLFRSKHIALISALLFSFLPWSVFNSRIGYEVNLAFTFFAFACLMFLKALKNNPKYLLLGAIAFSASTYTAHTERYLAPLFIFLFSLLFRKILLQQKYRQFLIISIITLVVTQMPNLFLVTQKAFWVKTDHLLTTTPYLAISSFFYQYIRYISPKSLFSVLPDSNLQRSAPGISVFYFWMFLPYLLGLFLTWLKRKNIDSKIILLLFLVCPIPAALDINTFSIQRAIPLLLPLFLIIIIGLDKFISKFKIITFLLLVFLSLFSIILLVRSYFIFLPKERAKSWNYGYAQLAEHIKNNPNKHFIINHSNEPAIYIELLFYLNYPPSDFQKNINTDIKNNYYSNTKFNPDYYFSNMEIRPINWQKDLCIDQVFVGDDLAISQDQVKEHYLKPFFEIRDPMSNLVLQAYETDPVKKCNSKANRFY